MMIPAIIDCELTRRWVDGGRDAVGTYRIGGSAGGVKVEFALEAKCYAPSNGVGVEGTARLISRLRNRQFGIFVTTSHISLQAYRELKDDGHPVLVLAARDISELLKGCGHTSPTAVLAWLEKGFPKRRSN